MRRTTIARRNAKKRSSLQTVPHRKRHRARRLFCESLEPRHLLTAVPSIVLDMDINTPGPQSTVDGLIGEDIEVNVKFDNTGTMLGYDPVVDLVVQYRGVDGQFDFAYTAPAVEMLDPAPFPLTTNPNPGEFHKEPDGLGVDKDGQPVSSYITATAEGLPLEIIYTPITATSGCVDHPLSVDSSGNPLLVCAAQGDMLVTARLPFGSFAHDQPIIDTEFTIHVSSAADIGDPLYVRARGGFTLGNTPVATDFLTDPSLNSHPSINSSAWAVGDVVPQVLIVRKGSNAPEGEIATGRNFPHTWSVVVDVAVGQTVNNLHVMDTLPDNLRYLDNLIVSHSYTPLSVPPVDSPIITGLNDVLQVVLNNSVSGLPSNDSEVELSFDFYIPEFDGVGNPILDPLTGMPPVTVQNFAEASGTWLPCDTRDHLGGNNTGNPITVSHSSSGAVLAKSLAIQKYARVNGGPWISSSELAEVKPSDRVDYRLDYQVSDFFGFANVVIDDYFTDGQQLVPGSLMLKGSDNSVSFPLFPLNSANYTVDALTAGAHCVANAVTPFEHHIQFRVSDEVAARGVHPLGYLLGDDFAPPPGQGATRGQVYFSVNIQDKYDIFNASGNPALNEHDEMGNCVAMAGDVLDSTLNLTGSTATDDSHSFLQVSAGHLEKTIFAVNGQTTGFGSPPLVAPGDTVTFRLKYFLTTGDFENFVLRDFLPHPKFIVGPLTEFTGSGTPAAGQWKLGTMHSPGLPAPAAAFSTVSNSVQWDFGTYDDPTNAGAVIDILFTVQATNLPFADRLYLTNQGVASHNDTHLHSVGDTAIVQIICSQPDLNIAKGVVATNDPDGVFSPLLPAGVWNAPGAATSFNPVINSANLPGLADSNLSNIDPGSLVTFAIVVENTGSSRRGAFDVKLKDTLPIGFKIPSGVLNLSVTDGTGALIPFTDLGGGLFGNGIELTDPGPTLTQGNGADAGALDRGTDESGIVVTNGRNIAVITYDLLLCDDLEPKTKLTNTATLFNYAGVEGGPDHTTTDRTDNAMVTSAQPMITKTVIDTDAPHTLGTNVTIGETVTYEVNIKVPHGHSSNFTFSDSVGPGMAIVDIDENSLAVSPALSASNGFLSAVLAGAAAIAPPGNGFLFDFGTVTNNDTNLSTPEEITFQYTTVVLNDAVNQAGDMLFNQVTVFWEAYSNEVQTIPSVGMGFSLEFNGDSTPFLAANATAGDVQSALENLSTIGAGNVIVTGDPGGPWTVRFTGDLCDQDVPSITGTTGPAVPAISFSASEDVKGGQFLYDCEVETSAKATIVIPQLEVEKTATPDHGQAGDVITIAIQVTNSGAFTTDAFETELRDALPPCMTFIVGSERYVGGPAPDAFTEVGGVVMANWSQIPAGATSEILFDVLLEPCVKPGQKLTNEADIEWTTLPALPIISGDGTSVVTFDFGTLFNSDLDPDTEIICIEFNALVMNTSANNAPDVKGNYFEVVITDPTTGMPCITTSNTVNVVVVEPQLDITKNITDFGGPTATFVVTITNNGTTTAFNTEFVDLLPSPEVTLTSVFVTWTGTVTGFVDNTFGNSILLDFATIDANAIITVTYVVELNQCDGILNTADVVYTNLPGPNGTTNNPTGSQTPGAAGDEDGERNGDGGVNDYHAADSQGLGSIGDFVWHDEDGDGVQDPGEPGIPWVRVDLMWAGPDGIFGTAADVKLSTMTDANGFYQFCGLPPGDYKVTVDPNSLAPEKTPTFDLDGGLDAMTNVNLAPGEAQPDVDFGFAVPGAIHGFKFEDLNANGQYEIGEPPIPGVTIELHGTDGLGNVVWDSMVTDANGEYWFMPLMPGTYTVTEVVQGMTQSTPDPDPIELRSKQIYVAGLPPMATDDGITPVLTGTTLELNSNGSALIVVTANGPDLVVNCGQHVFPGLASTITQLSVVGGAGVDKIDLSHVNAASFPALTVVAVDAGGGDDIVIGSELADVLMGGAGSDNVRGGEGDDVIEGNADDDELDGGAGNDVIDGGTGNDNLCGDDGNDVLHGGAHDDLICGGAGDNVIFGDDGDDRLSGGDGSDIAPRRRGR